MFVGKKITLWKESIPLIYVESCLVQQCVLEVKLLLPDITRPHFK